MKKRVKWIITILLLGTICSWILVEYFLITRAKIKLSKDLAIEVKTIIEPGGFIDINSHNTILINNHKTNAKLKLKFVTITSKIYFFLDTLSSQKTISIIDEYWGENKYDLNNLSLIGKSEIGEDENWSGRHDYTNGKILAEADLVFDGENLIVKTNRNVSGVSAERRNEKEE